MYIYICHHIYEISNIQTALAKHEEQQAAEPTVAEIFLRCEIVDRLLSGSSTIASNQFEAEHVMSLCENDVHFKDALFEAKDLQTVGYMKYFRSTALELRESVSGASASEGFFMLWPPVHFYYHFSYV